MIVILLAHNKSLCYYKYTSLPSSVLMKMVRIWGKEWYVLTPHWSVCSLTSMDLCLPMNLNNELDQWRGTVFYVQCLKYKKYRHWFLEAVACICTYTFWTVVLERTLENPLDCKEIKSVNPKGNQSWIIIGRMLKLKRQYFSHMMWRIDSLEKTLVLGRIKDRRRWDNRGWDSWMASPTWWTWVWASSEN